MIRIVADTNVYVSAIVFGRTCEEILALARSGIVEINISPAIKRELRRVLRTGFQWTEPQVRAALTEVETLTSLVYPTVKLTLSETVQKMSTKIDALLKAKCSSEETRVCQRQITDPKPDLQKNKDEGEGSTPLPRICTEPKKPTLEGWVYVGLNLGRHWDEKHFNWDSYNKHLPKKEDILTATGLVNLRERFGKDAPIVGVICPEVQVEVEETKTLPEGYHWVRIERAQTKQGSL